MRFTIRELLLVTVIVAMSVGWAIERARLDTTLKQLQMENDSLRLVIREGGFEVSHVENGRINIHQKRD